MLERSIEIMTSANRSRKYDFGSQKRKNKQRLDDLTQSQKGATDGFIVKESQVSANNQILDQNPALDSNVVCLVSPTLDFRTTALSLAWSPCPPIAIRRYSHSYVVLHLISGHMQITNKTHEHILLLFF